MCLWQHLRHSLLFVIKLHASPFSLATHTSVRFCVWRSVSTVPEEDEWRGDLVSERLAKCHSARLLLSCASLHPCRILMMHGKRCKHVIAIMFILPAGSAWPSRSRCVIFPPSQAFSDEDWHLILLLGHGLSDTGTWLLGHLGHWIHTEIQFIMLCWFMSQNSLYLRHLQLHITYAC